MYNDRHRWHDLAREKPDPQAPREFIEYLFVNGRTKAGYNEMWLHYAVGYHIAGHHYAAEGSVYEVAIAWRYVTPQA